MDCRKGFTCLLVAGLLATACEDTRLHLLPAEPDRRSPEFTDVNLTEPLDRIDTYQQIDAKVDILWVVDNSRSMIDEQAKLAENFNTFIGFMVQTLVDYHIGVISTTMNDSGGGELVGDPRYITSTTPNAVTEFSDRVKLETSQGASEEGLLAAASALTEPKLSGVNAGFIRPEAGLFIIVVTDENDRSFGPVEYYQRKIRSLKGPGNEDLVSLSAITGLEPDGCTPPGLEDVFGAHVHPGARYLSVAEKTGGLSFSICEPDFSPALASLGISVAGLRRIFPLSREPEIESIRVLVNEQEIAADPQTGWTYLFEINSIYFEGLYVPESRAMIEVHYSMRP